MRFSVDHGHRLLVAALSIVAPVAFAAVAEARPLHAHHARHGHHRAGVKRVCGRHAHKGRRACHARKGAARQVLAWTGTGPAPGTSRSMTATAGCADAHLMPAAGNLGRVATATLCLINQQRHNAGERALTNDVRLDHAADLHSNDMVAQGYFAQDSPTGSSLVSRLTDMGYLAPGAEYAVAENIAWNTGVLATPAGIVAAWMSTPAHRANILRAAFRQSGIGVAAGAPGPVAPGRPDASYTQDFGVTA